jgi:hypothetical protein
MNNVQDGFVIRTVKYRYTLYNFTVFTIKLYGTLIY